MKARAEDKLLRQKQKDSEKELLDLGASKKDLRFLGESLDSYFFPQARRIKRDTISETLHQEADDEFWKLNEKNIQDRRIASGKYDLCFEIYSEDFLQLPFNKTLRDDKKQYDKWVNETGYITTPLIYGLAKEKLDKFHAHICTDEEKKIEKEEDSLAWRVTARSQGRDPDYIPPNIHDLLEGFTESEEDAELSSPNHQKERLQPSNLKKQPIQNTKPLFRIPSKPGNSIHIDSPNTMTKRVDLAQNDLTVIPGPTTRAGRTTK